MDNLTSEKKKILNIKVSQEIHDKIYKIIEDDRKKNLRSADDVLRFLFEQYEEKLKDKIASMHDKENFEDFLIQEIKIAFKEFDKNLKIMAKGIMFIEERLKVR